MNGIASIFDNRKRGWAGSFPHPCIKLLILILLLCAISLTLSSVAYLTITVVMLLLLLSLKISLSEVRLLMLPLATMMLITIVLYLLFDRSGGKILEIAGLVSVSISSLKNAGLICWRISLFGMAGLAFLLAMTPDQLSEAALKFLRPLRHFRLPANDIALVLLIAIRFIPTLLQQSSQIVRAQKARGAEFSGGLVSRARQAIPLVIPVIVAALRQADTLADSLTVRAWGCTNRRTYYRETKLRVADFLILLLFAALTVFVLWPRS